MDFKIESLRVFFFYLVIIIDISLIMCLCKFKIIKHKNKK